MKNYLEYISHYTGTANVYFYWKGRVALYALLKAMGVGPQAEVVIPGFTCAVVPNAIKYLGAKPVYVDIDRKTLNPTCDHYKNALSDNTKVLVVQNTFGLSSEVIELVDLAKSRGIFTIEDCTHGFGGTYKGQPNGSYCDAAFYSTQWNKPFSTGIGGFCIFNNDHLISDLEAINKGLKKPSLKDSMTLSALIKAHKILAKPATYWTVRRLYRWLSKNGLVIGSSSGGELESVEMPSGYFKGASPVQKNQGLKNVRNLADVLTLRKENAKKYTEALKGLGKYYVDESLHQDHSFLKYPILVNDRKAFEELAEQHKIDLGDWFCSPALSR